MAQPQPNVALLAGASGFAGGHLLEALLGAAEFARVFAVTRRPLGREHPRLANRIVQFEQLESQLRGLRCQVAFCCLGAAELERADAASLARVDLGLSLAFARAAKAAGAERFVVLSAAGAAAQASSPYLRVKGELERELEGLRFACLDILQPAALFGWPMRSPPAQWLRRAMLPLVNPLLLGERAAQRAVPVRTLAAAMLGASRSGRRGVQRYAYPGICALARLKSPRMALPKRLSALAH